MTRDSQAGPGLSPLGGRLSIRQRLIGAVVMILILFGVASLVSLGTIKSVGNARQVAERVVGTLIYTAELRDAVARKESAMRAYVLAGAPRFVEIERMTADQFDNAIDELYRRVDDSPEQRRRIQEIEQLGQRWNETVVEPIVARVQAGDLEGARQVLVGDSGTPVIDPMRATLDAFRTQVRRDLASTGAVLENRQQRARRVQFGIVCISLLLGLLTVAMVTRQVTRPLSELSDTTRRLARGERDIAIRFSRRGDEIGAMAHALETFRQIIIEQDRQSWLREQQARLTALLQQSQSEQALGRQLLETLSPLFGAGYSALFTPTRDDRTSDGDEFTLIASYGYSDSVGKTFTVGEGLVGQVMASGETIVLDQVPDTYLPVRSGLGEGQPVVLIVLPARLGREVVGVLEMALMRPPSADERELLDLMLPRVALTLRTLARTRRTVELLEQSQAQTEAVRESEQRLQERTEELKKANHELRVQSEELNAQSEELRASEEELKVQSDDLQASNEELRQRQELMREQQEELSRLHSEAKQRADDLARASQYKSEFLANMSHELRTPLNSLLILSRSLADNEAGHLDDEETEAAGIIHESGTNLLTLINDILDLSKIEAGKMTVTAQTTVIATLVQHLRRDFDHVADGKGITFEVQVHDEAPDAIVTDLGKLEQVVRNLVSNAIKFTERGAVRVEIGPAGPDQVFKTPGLAPADVLAIHVVDEGIGIPTDRLEQIFESFEQVDGGTSRTYGGTGLGLSISRELARLLGGEIAVKSELGAGSRFSIYIRRVLDETEAIEPADESADSATASKRAPTAVDASVSGARAPHVLIIDDDATFSNMIAKAARERGYVASTAADGEHGLDMVRQQVPDAIVLDLGLPGMDGWAVLDRLKANTRTRNIPVHIASAADDTGQSTQAGAVGFLGKPIAKSDLDTLFARAAALSGREARRVLVVDDDSDAHAAIMHLLKNEDVEVQAVVDGQSALATLDKEKFDCVVLDLKLPDISGFELIERIATREHAPPVVVYSARELSEDETRRLRAYTDSIVIKGTRAQERLLDEISLFFHQLDAQPARQDKPAVAAMPDTNLDGKTALLVDDDMRNTFALSRVLRARGMKVLMAGDGFKALDQLEKNEQIAVVLMDIMMPGMDGYETIRRIRAQSAHAGLPIIAVTAKAMSGDQEKCLEAGADAYLPKPLDTERLVDRIRELVT